MKRVNKYLQILQKHEHFLPPHVKCVETMFRHIRNTRQRRNELQQIPGIALYKKHLFGWLKTTFVYFNLEQALESGDLIQGGTKPFEWVSFIDCAPLPPHPSPNYLSPTSTTSSLNNVHLPSLQLLTTIHIDENDLICPLTQERFIDPVVASDGQTYERRAIENWIKRGKGTARSPIRDDVILKPVVYPNDLLSKLLK